MTTTDLLIRTLLGRARDSVTLDAVATSAAVSHVPTLAYVTTVRTHAVATDVATNPWLGGFGFGEGVMCPTIDGSTKRIHPGRLEGVT